MNEVELSEEARLQAARELVIRSAPVDQSPVMALDGHTQLLAEFAECQEMVTFWKKRLDRLKVALAAVLGDAHRGTVNGEEVVFHEPVARFDSTSFRNKYPNMYRAYLREVYKQELDVEALKLSRPELYTEFQVRPLRMTWEPPGSAK